ncbi:MAG TPA: FAD-binding oxidoreductase [Methylomirabilota bacterium]|jgi:sarcosine oxidase subunit beta
MSQAADLVVIGAGIAGASTACFAARAGLRVVVVDRGLPAGGATGRTAGYIRCHYANQPEAHFAVESWRMHRRWSEAVGGENGYRRNGFLFIVPPVLVPTLEKNVALMQAMGVPTEVLDGKGVKRLLPFAETDGIGAAAWEPESGHADPSDCVAGLLACVRDGGGRVLTDGEPAHVVTEGGRVAGIRLGPDRIVAPAVVLAAGAGSRELAAELGVDLPVFPMPIGAGLLHGLPGLDRVPCTIDHAAEQWYRGEIGDALLIGAGYEDSIGFRGEPFHGKAAFAPPTLDELVSAATRLIPRIPTLERAAPGRTWVGLDSRTPDGHALAGPVPGVPGLFVLTGGNGKGFKFGPSMGRALAEVVRGADFGASPLAPFAVDRDARGQVIQGEHEYKWGSFA